MKRFFTPTLLLALSALLSRLLGVGRDHLLARTFGASAGSGLTNLDAYYAAFRIPDLFYNLIIVGAVSAAFIPIFARLKKGGRTEDAWAFASAMLRWMLLGVGVLAAAAWMFAEPLTHLVAGGFKSDDFAITVRLMRILLLSPILFAAASVLTSVADSFKVFFWRSLAPLFYNLGIMAGIIFWAPQSGVVGVTWGVILGAALQFVVQMPVLWQTGFKYSVTSSAVRPELKHAFAMMGPRVLTIALRQIAFIASTRIASTLGTGAITVLYLADNLQSLPLGMVGVAFSITSFATLSELAAEPTHDGFAQEMRRVLQKVLYWTIPAIAGLYVLRREVIDFLFVHGKFTDADAALLATVLSFFLIGLAGNALIPTLNRGFFAHHDSRTPLISAACGSTLAVMLSVFLVFKKGWGAEGVALGFAAEGLTTCGLLIYFLKRRVRQAVFNGPAVGRIVMSTFVMALAVLVLKQFLPYGGTFLQKILLLALYAGAGGGAYLGMSRWRIKKI